MPPFNRKTSSSCSHRTHALASSVSASAANCGNASSNRNKRREQRNLLNNEMTSSDAYLSDVENNFCPMVSMKENSALALAVSASSFVINSAGEESACDSDVPLTTTEQSRRRRGNCEGGGRSNGMSYNARRKSKTSKKMNSTPRSSFARDSIVDDDNHDVRDDGAGWSESEASADALNNRSSSAGGKLITAARRYRRKSNKKKSPTNQNGNSFDESCDSEFSDGSASASGGSTDSAKSKNLVKADRMGRSLWRSKARSKKSVNNAESKDSDVSDLSDASDIDGTTRKKKSRGGKVGGKLAGKSKKKMKSIMKSLHVGSSSTLSGSTSGTGTTDTTAPPSPRTDFDGMEYDLDSRLVPVSLSPNLVGLRYSLRSAVGDGGARQPHSTSVMQRRDLTPNGCHLNTSHWSHRGRRSYMEDRYAIEELGVQRESSAWNSEFEPNANPLQHNEDEEVEQGIVPMTWFGVFDGHGGERASQFCVDWLSSYVRHHQAFPTNLGTVLRDSFRSVDSDFVRTGLQDGTTACTCVVQGKKRIFCANAGDSRAIVVRRDGSVVRLSRDHKPGLLDETKRITDLGGKVIYWGRWRVEGLLAVSRSVGDAALKPYVTADPEICEYDIEEEDMFLVMASDGIWDVLSNEQVAKLVITHSCFLQNECLLTDTERLRWTARKLCEKARKSGSSDNFAAIVSDLRNS